MDAPAWEDFTTQFPQFATADYITIGPLQLGTSAALLDPGTWAEQYQRGVMLDCAHNLTLLGAVGSKPINAIGLAAGPVSSTSAAGTSTSFNTVSPSDKNTSADFYQKTLYGQMFLRLRNIVCPLAVADWA